MTLCTNCGINEAPTPISLEIDPLCEECISKLGSIDRQCPGYGESCGNMLEGDSDLCPDCRMIRLDAQSPRIPR